MQALWGSTGPEFAPVERWKNVARTAPWKIEDDEFWTALDDLISASEYDEIMAKMNSSAPTAELGAIDGSVLVTANWSLQSRPA